MCLRDKRQGTGKLKIDPNNLNEAQRLSEEIYLLLEEPTKEKEELLRYAYFILSNAKGFRTKKEILLKNKEILSEMYGVRIERG